MLGIGAAKAQGGRDEMQDFYAVVQENDMTFVGIFDGHGKRGEIVAQFCAQRLPREVLSRAKTCSPQTAILESIGRMDQELRAEYGEDEETLVEIGGSTAVVALLHGSESVVVAIVGDGRCILCKGGLAMDLCGEHKPDHPREMARIKAAGGRVVDGRVLCDVSSLDMSRSIGDFEFKMNHKLDCNKQMVISVPEVHAPRMLGATEEFLVVTSDGIEAWESQEVVDFIRNRLAASSQQPLDSICEDLLQAVDAADNMSVVVVQLKAK